MPLRRLKKFASGSLLLVGVCLVLLAALWHGHASNKRQLASVPSGTHRYVGKDFSVEYPASGEIRPLAGDGVQISLAPGVGVTVEQTPLSPGIATLNDLLFQPNPESGSPSDTYYASLVAQAAITPGTQVSSTTFDGFPAIESIVDCSDSASFPTEHLDQVDVVEGGHWFILSAGDLCISTSSATQAMAVLHSIELR